MLARRPATQIQALPRDRLHGFTILKLGLAPDRASLYLRLDDRSASLFRNGLLEEVRALLAAGMSPRAKPLESLGYKQAIDVIEGRFTLDQAVRECQTKTRQYAKRQLTWFRADPDVRWLAGFGWEQGIQIEAVELARAFLAEHRLGS